MRHRDDAARWHRDDAARRDEPSYRDEGRELAEGWSGHSPGHGVWSRDSQEARSVPKGSFFAPPVRAGSPRDRRASRDERADPDSRSRTLQAELEAVVLEHYDREKAKRLTQEPSTEASTASSEATRDRPHW